MATKNKPTADEMLDWLEEHEGFALVSDDFGHWAVTGNGTQSIPENPPDDVETTFFIEKREWRESIREAILCAMEED